MINRLLWQVFKRFTPLDKLEIQDGRGVIIYRKHRYFWGITFRNMGRGWELAR